AEPRSPLVRTDRLDHIHLYALDRPAAVRWYADVLGLTPYGPWREEDPPDEHPVFLATASGTFCVSIFVGERPEGGDRTVAFHADGPAFIAFAQALPDPRIPAYNGAPLTADGRHDYGMAITLNMLDPAGNHVELVTYDTGMVREALS
ncbi:MAG: VOC family protein, partial [Pseudomonadota bacterium]